VYVSYILLTQYWLHHTSLVPPPLTVPPEGLLSCNTFTLFSRRDICGYRSMFPLATPSYDFTPCRFIATDSILMFINKSALPSSTNSDSAITPTHLSRIDCLWRVREGVLLSDGCRRALRLISCNLVKFS